MKYELPKSYAQRPTTHASTPHTSRPRPRPPADARLSPRPGRPNTPLSRASSSPVHPSSAPPSPVNSAPATQSTPPAVVPAHASPSFPSQGEPASPPVSSSTYQQLLIELRSRQQENAHLKHITQQLLSDVSVLQAKYAQAISAPFAKPVNEPKQRPSNAETKSPQVARQAISKALAKLSVFERLRPSQQSPSAPATQPGTTAPLPELSVLNRLRQSQQQSQKQAALRPNEATVTEEFTAPSQASSAPASSTAPGQTVPEPNAPSGHTSVASRTMPAISEPLPLSTQPSPRPRREQPAALSPNPVLSQVPPVVEDERIPDYDYASPYQKARQEQAQATPLWIWLLAWILLLPISAGLGYTFVQWVMNPGAPSNSPPPIEQAE